MGKIFDYKCTFLDNIHIDDDILNNNSIKFPDVHLYCEEMVKYAKLRKEISKAHFVELPFCHTVEAESLGGKIVYGDAITGPRAKEFIYDNLIDILDIGEIDFEKGRIYEVLKAIKMLSLEGEDIVFEVSGPFTILNSLVDSEVLFKTLRKDRDLMKKVYDKIGKEIYKFIDFAIKNGAKYISFADSAAAVGIIGPKYTKEYVEDFLYEFIKQIVELSKNKSATILICPRITFALYGMDLIRFNNVPLDKEMPYFDAIKMNIDKIKLTGQMCIKNRDYILKPPFIKELIFSSK